MTVAALTILSVSILSADEEYAKRLAIREPLARYMKQFDKTKLGLNQA
jgi:hypothetical protein